MKKIPPFVVSIATSLAAMYLFTLLKAKNKLPGVPPHA